MPHGSRLSKPPSPAGLAPRAHILRKKPGGRRDATAALFDDAPDRPGEIHQPVVAGEIAGYGGAILTTRRPLQRKRALPEGSARLPTGHGPGDG